MFSKIKRVLERLDKMSSTVIINGWGWEPNDKKVFRIDSWDKQYDFRERREYVSLSNNFLEHMSLDELRQFKNEIWWIQDFIKQLAKRSDFKKICEQFREEIREVYEKWGTEIEWDDFTEGKEWKEYLRI